MATDQLSLELSAQASTGDDVPNEDELINADRKLLVLLSNCAFVRGSIMPSLIDRCVLPPSQGYMPIAPCAICMSPQDRRKGCFAE